MVKGPQSISICTVLYDLSGTNGAGGADLLEPCTLVTSDPYEEWGVSGVFGMCLDILGCLGTFRVV